MFRNIIAIFIGFLITILLSLELIFGLSLLKLNSPDFYKQSFNEANFYASTEEILKNLVTEFLVQSGSSELNLGSLNGTEFGDVSPVFKDYLTLVQKETDNIFNNLLNTEDIKLTIDTNVDRFFAFLNSNTPDMSIYIPETKLVNNIEANLKKITTSSINFFKKAPTCSSSEETVFFSQLQSSNKTTLRCLPESIKDQFVDSFNSVTDDTAAKALEQLKRNNPILNGDNEISLREIDQLNKAQGSNLLANAQNARQSLNLAKIMLAVNLFVITVLALLFIVIIKVHFFRKISILGLFILFSTSTLLITALILKLIFSVSADSNYGFNELFPGDLSVIGEFTKRLMTNLADYLISIGIVSSLVVFAITVVTFFLHRTGKKMAGKDSSESTESIAL